jgi:CHASE3 domain sensor protein
MVAKLALVLFVLAVVVSLTTLAAFWYFNQESEREHERELREMEQTDEILDAMDDSVDRELEREKNE